MVQTAAVKPEVAVQTLAVKPNSRGPDRDYQARQSRPLTVAVQVKPAVGDRDFDR